MTDGRVDPRIKRSRRRGREAALAELVENGLGGFSVESVAARSGLGKSTIYRLWGDRQSLVLDALEQLNRQPPPEPGDEVPRDRVRTLLAHLVEAWAPATPVGAALPALIDAAERDEALGEAFARYSRARMAALVNAVADAVTAGDARPGTDAELAARALAGALLQPRVLARRPLDADDIDPLMELVLGPAG